jgi:hypothetical protein
MSGRARIKTVIFVTTSLSIALALMLGAGCHREHGPVLLHEEGAGPLSATPPPSPLEGGRAKGSPELAGPERSPPPATGPVPGSTTAPLGMPYEHDGPRINHSLTTGAPSTDQTGFLRP